MSDIVQAPPQGDEIQWEESGPADELPVAPRRPWKLLVADDDDSVHRVTAMVLADLRVQNRPVQLLRADSGAQALALLRRHADIAVLLLDVVMESETAGLDIVREIREGLGNSQLRIILRTGQPGHAPERDVMARYEIDGYESKTELSAQRLTTAVTSALRAYDQVTANRAKSEFLANMSHELRTPMHAILSFVEIARLRLRSGESSLEKTDHFLSRIDESGRRLLRLLDDLLDVAKLEAGGMRYDFGPQSIDGIVEAARLEFEPLAADKSVTLTTVLDTGDIRVWCDAFRTGQVIRNLLSNAIKYTPPGSQVRVRMADATLDGGAAAVLIEVIDEGVGVPEAELEAIFDKFVQSSKTRSGAGGTGLGLAICREIIEQHGGAIGARNQPGGGACFRVMLPRLAPASDVAGEGDGGSGEAGGPGRSGAAEAAGASP